MADAVGGSFVMGNMGALVTAPQSYPMGSYPLAKLAVEMSVADYARQYALLAGSLLFPELAPLFALLADIQQEQASAVTLDEIYHLWDYTPASGPPVRNGITDLISVLSLISLQY